MQSDFDPPSRPLLTTLANLAVECPHDEKSNFELIFPPNMNLSQLLRETKSEVIVPDPSNDQAFGRYRNLNDARMTTDDRGRIDAQRTALENQRKDHQLEIRD